MKNQNIFIIVITFLLLVGCTNGFEDINTNPNQPEEVSADLLLATVISTLANESAQSGWSNGNIVAQLVAKINFTGFDRYDWGSESGLWNTYYDILPEIELILDSARSEESKNTSYEGMALVMRSYAYANLTDNWGDVPFSEAIKGDEDNFKPVYDTQETIYAGILEDLRTAVSLLEMRQAVLGGDILYDGDIDKWIKFANSLRLRYLMRASKKMEVGNEIKAILDSGKFIGSNEDNAVMEYSASTQIDSWPVSNGRIGGFDERRLSKTSEAVLKQFNDNRLQRWFQPTDNPMDDPSLFAGMPNGLSEDNASNYNGGAKNVSRLNQALFYDSPNAVKAAIIQAAEVHFIFAEAAQRNLITADAEMFYNEGIRLSFEYWGVTQDITAYIAQEGVAYDATLETIITQKWLASFLVAHEAWYDYRRTGFPSVIVPGSDNVNNDMVPVRFLYPDTEQNLNNENYQAAVSRIGGDNINSKGWWED